MRKSTSHPQILRLYRPLTPTEVIELLDKMFQKAQEKAAEKFRFLWLRLNQRLTEKLSEEGIDPTSRVTKALVSFTLRQALELIFEPPSSLCFDKYLEFQYQMCASFYSNLFHLIAAADTIHLARLQQVYPNEVQAYLFWTTRSLEEFSQHCSDGPLLDKFKKEYHIHEILPND